MSQITPFFPPASSLTSKGGNGVALIFEGEGISYGEISRQARAWAEQGVRAGDLVAVLSPSSLTITRTLYAALQLGMTIFPLATFMPDKRRDRLLAQAGCNLVLRDIELDKIRESSGTTSDVQLILATSGSEGEPKGVMLSGGNIAASIAASRNRLGLKSGDLWLNCLSMFHVGGIMIAYRCLDAGAGMLLHSGFDADRVWVDLNNYPVTHISLVPAMLARLLDISGDATPPDSLRVALIGGGHLAPKLAARARAAGWPLCVSYGMSETCSQCATDCGERAGLIPGQVGMPLDGFEIALSSKGRIKLRGPAVMLGYLNSDQTPGQGLSDDGWFESGDLGEIDASGCLRVLGRADDVLISGGNNIHPSEIEDLMVDCPGLDEVAISSRPDQAWGDVIVAVYAGRASIDDVEVWCRANLSSIQRPREFIQVPELPRNSMGKLDRDGLRAMLAQG